jgi:hypothetical protein
MYRLTLLIIIVSYYSCTNSKSKDSEKANEAEYVRTQKISPEKTMSDDEYNQIFALYDTRDVKQLRITLDQYSEKSFKEIVTLYPDNIELVKTMYSYRGVFNSKFVIVGRSSNFGGGYNYYIIFKDKPDHIFSVWIYTEDNSEVRSFKDIEYTPKERKDVLTQHKYLVENLDHSI